MAVTNTPIPLPHRAGEQTITFRDRVPYLTGQLNQIRANTAARLVPRLADGTFGQITLEADLIEHTRLTLEQLLTWVKDWTLLKEDGSPLPRTVAAAMEELTEDDIEFLSWRGADEAEKAAFLAQLEEARAARAAASEAEGAPEEEGPFVEAESFSVGGAA